MNVPKIRFKGFEGEWKTALIGDIAPVAGGYAFLSNLFVLTGIPVVRISNILESGIVGGEFANYKMLKGDESFRLYNGDAVIAMSGATTGKVAVVRNTQFMYQNQRVGKFTKTGKVDYGLLTVIVSSQKFRKDLVKLLTYSAQPNASSRDIDSIIEFIPNNRQEQKQIASYFTHLDSLISASTYRLASLKQVKEASLQAMFPQEGETVPKVRFKGFEGEWKKVKLGEIAIINPKCELPDSFEYVDLESVSGTIMKSHRRENKVSAPSRAQRLAEKGDIFYQTVRPYQKNNYYYQMENKDYVFSTGYAQIRALKDALFLFTVIQSNQFLKQIMDNCTGTSFPAINPSSLRNLWVYDCDMQEQQVIGKYFTALDRRITLQTQRLEKLKQIKAACLDKMFV